MEEVLGSFQVAEIDEEKRRNARLRTRMGKDVVWNSMVPGAPGNGATWLEHKAGPWQGRGKA